MRRYYSTLSLYMYIYIYIYIYHTLIILRAPPPQTTPGAEPTIIEIPELRLNTETATILNWSKHPHIYF